MSYVSAALTRAVKELHISQTKLSESSGVQRGMLNRYMRGAQLGQDNLPKLVAALPEPHKSALVAAYARDWVPEAEQSLVQISSANGHTAPAAVVLPPDLDPDLRDALIYLAERGLRHPQIRDMVLQLVGVLRGT